MFLLVIKNCETLFLTSERPSFIYYIVFCIKYIRVEQEECNFLDLRLYDTSSCLKVLFNWNCRPSRLAVRTAIAESYCWPFLLELPTVAAWVHSDEPQVYVFKMFDICTRNDNYTRTLLVTRCQNIFSIL